MRDSWSHNEKSTGFPPFGLIRARVGYALVLCFSAGGEAKRLLRTSPSCQPSHPLEPRPCSGGCFRGLRGGLQLVSTGVRRASSTCGARGCNEIPRLGGSVAPCFRLIAHK